MKIEKFSPFLDPWWVNRMEVCSKCGVRVALEASDGEDLRKAFCDYGHSSERIELACPSCGMFTLRFLRRNG